MLSHRLSSVSLLIAVTVKGIFQALNIVLVLVTVLATFYIQVPVPVSLSTLPFLVQYLSQSQL